MLTWLPNELMSVYDFNGTEGQKFHVNIFRRIVLIAV